MIDSHCHLDFKHYTDNRDQVIEQAKQAGVHTIINIGVDIKSSENSVELAGRYDQIYATVGVHPHDANKVTDDDFEKLSRLAQQPKVVAIGEIGLDYYRDLSPRSIQKKVFRKQLELAIESHLPIVIHSRESFKETVAIVREYAARLSGGVFHCFPGNAEDAREVIDMGFLISVGGVITYKNSSMAAAAAEIDLDKIMIETDAPYLTPVPFRGQTNQPAYVRYVCEKLAEIKGISFSEVEKATDRTCQKLFGLVEVFGG